MITGSAESPMIWLQKFKYTFGTIPPVNYTGASPIETLTALNPAPKSAVILGSNDTFSKATAEAFKEAAEKAGILAVIPIVAHHEILPVRDENRRKRGH